MADRPLVDVPAMARLSRDVVRATGPDAVSFLQGQLSQDLDALAVGDATWSFLLEPQGHIEALLRVVRAAEGDIVLLADDGLGPAVVERLERFKLRVKADIAVVEATVWAVRGPAGVEVDPGTGDSGSHLVAPSGDGRPGVDVVAFGEGTPSAHAEVGEEWYEAMRIEAGIPVIGRDVLAGAIPAETGMVDRAVSFTKGCYTGQELVARVDSRGGRAPRRIVGLVADTEVPAGAPLLVEGEEVGTVTSVAGPPVRSPSVGLARVKRSVEVPAEVEVGGAGLVARLTTLPLVS